MATETSSIDDLLTAHINGTEPSVNEEIQDEVNDNADALIIEGEPDTFSQTDPLEETDSTPETTKEPERDPEEDDYGNKPEPENEAIRERLARQARKHEAEMAALRAQLTANQSLDVNKAVEAFEYNPNEGGDWQQQLASFVKQTVQNMGAEQQRAAEQQRELQQQYEFESKFREDVQRFPDFEQAIVGVGAEISDPMVYATRSMKNPAAFLYAAAKRAPAELQRIAKMQDPYAQIAAVGALEVTLRQTKPASKAPRPIARANDDGMMPVHNEKKETIEDLIAASEMKMRAKLQQRRGGR